MSDIDHSVAEKLGLSHIDVVMKNEHGEEIVCNSDQVNN